MPSPDLSAALTGRYRVERELGQGGMATVYLAQDLRHDRKVALKVLRPELAAAIGAERFLQEIKTTANLHHPHILPLFDSGSADGLLYYVMPFVAGESLRARLTRDTQLPLADALRITAEVAAALDYAHRQGVVHRDIKPENILLHDGQALVSDFGIALALSVAGENRMTRTGMSLGTPAYMAPEQAMGEEAVDARADIHALGAVTYEMLTGELPFQGRTAQAIAAKLLTEAPEPPNRLRSTVPDHVSDAVLVALQKLPADRFQSAGEFARALSGESTVRLPRSRTERRGARSQYRGGIVVGLTAAAFLLGGGAAQLLRSRGGPAALVAQFDFPPPDSVTQALYGDFTPVFPTRDGRLLWATSEALYERALNGLAVRRLRPWGNVRNPRIQDESPDGKQLLVVWSTRSNGSHVSLNAVSLADGTSRFLADSADFAVWGPDDFVYFTYRWPAARRSGLARVSAQGGPVDTLARFRITEEDVVTQDLTVLPNGQGVVAVLGTRPQPMLSAFDLRTRTWRELGEGGPSVKYVAPGYLLFSSGRSVMAAPFDLRRLRFTRSPLPVVEVSQPAVRFAATADLLVYQGTEGRAPEEKELALRGRNGTVRILPNVTPGWRFSSAVVSPDGRRFLAVGSPLRRRSGLPDTAHFVYELPAGPLTRLVGDPEERAPTWLPGGREIGYVRISQDTPRVWTLMRRPWDGSGTPIPITSRRAPLAQPRWLPDGRGIIVLYQPGLADHAEPENRDLGLISLDRPDSIHPLVVSPAREGGPAVSPDGRYLAYHSDESGRLQVYVRSLAGGVRRQVSPAGGFNPRWAWSGRELFFQAAGGLQVARIHTGGELSVGAAISVFRLAPLQITPAPLHGDSIFVATADFVPLGPKPNLNVLVNLQPVLARLFAGASTPP